MIRTKQFYLTALIIIVCIIFNSCGKDGSDNSNDPTISECNTAGEVEQSTNTEIEAMRQAMVSFRSSLSETLLSQGSNCLDDERFYIWHNTPSNANRDGIYYSDLSATQLTSFKALLQLFLSSDGYQKVDEITVLSEGFVSQIGPAMFDPDFYSIDMFGDPETSGSWGFQLDGHHCAINFLVHGDNISMVPAFLGAEPAIETFNGIDFDIFRDERNNAITLFNGLTSTENTAATSTGSTETLIVGSAPQQGVVDPFRGDYDYSGFAEGLRYTDMSAATQTNAIILMQEYVYNFNTAFADVWWADIMANIDDTYFVWVGNSTALGETSEFYYRIYNPYLWVEYNNENSIGPIADHNHVHTITRIPNNPATDNGGDYGIFAQMINKSSYKTLYEHYANANHHKKSIIKFDYKVNMPHTHDNEHSHTHSHKG